MSIRCSRLPRLLRLFGVVGALATGLMPAAASAIPDPSLTWYTIDAPHVRVSFHSGERELAIRAADVAEDAIERLTRVLDHKLSRKVEILLSDPTDDSNGSATTVPYHQVRLYATAPDDISTLGFYDDWMTELVTHELTHIVHIDDTRGIPSWVNAVFGPRWYPNQVQPRWLIEGLAVTQESALTSGGRLRSSVWDMYLRADFLEDNVRGLDRMSHYVYGWPQGNIWYLYGSHLVDWVRRTYGDAALQSLSHDYGANPMPYGMGKSARATTGRNVEQWYEDWVKDTHRRYQAQVNSIDARGHIEGTRRSSIGGQMRAPRWISASHPWRKYGDILVASDGHEERGGIYALDTSMTQAPKLLVRTSGNFAATLSPDGALWTTNRDITKYVYSTGDVLRVPRGEQAPNGHSAESYRLSIGARTDDIDVSPDGRWLAMSSNRRGTRKLMVAEIIDGKLAEPREVAPLGATSQVYTPRFSHDGSKLAFSAWTPGGYRDIFLLDLRSHSLRRLSHDRATEGAPSFSPDDASLYFHGDRSGVSNIYRTNLNTGQTEQLTNVYTGAYYPEVSPDGQTLAYVGYTHKGFDLYTLALASARTIAVGENIYDALPELAAVPHRDYTVRPYSAIETFAPRNYALSTAASDFGQAYAFATHMEDIVGLHAMDLNLSMQSQMMSPDVSLFYGYKRYPVTISLGAARSITAQRNVGYNDRSTTIPRENWSLSSGLFWNKARAFSSQSFGLSYSWTRSSNLNDVPLPAAPDPERVPSLPSDTQLGVVRLNYSYSNAESYLGSIGPERGWNFGVGVALSDPWLGSQSSGASVQGSLTGYVPMPWGHHHALALRGAAGVGRGNQGGFYVGGYATYPLIDTIRQTLIQGGGVLRGFGDAGWGGREYILTNAEYRFPIARIERGLSTLPVFLSRVSGNVFVDHGGAYASFRDSPFHTGTGAELWWDLQLGYFLPFTFRTGYAVGLTQGGTGRAYFAATVPY